MHYFSRTNFNLALIKILIICITALFAFSCTQENSGTNKSAASKYDEVYSGYLYFENNKFFYFEFEIENGTIIPITSDSENSLALYGTVDDNGSFEASSELGYDFYGTIANGFINGDWENILYAGSFSGVTGIQGNSLDEDEEEEDSDEEQEEEENNNSENYNDLDAEFNMIIEGPIGTYGAYWTDPIDIEFKTYNDHIQNYSNDVEFSWKYHINSSGDLEEEDFDIWPDIYTLTEFSNVKTYVGHSFTEEFQLSRGADTNYVYIRLDIKRPDGSHAKMTKKAVFPMIRSSGFLQIGEKYYSFDPEDVPKLFTYKNIEDYNDLEDYRDYSLIQIKPEGFYDDPFYLEIASYLPANILTPFGQLGDPECCYNGGYTRNGFYISYSDYETFDDPDKAYSSGIWGIDTVNFIEGMQNTIELEFTLRGKWSYNKDEEIKGKLMLYNVYSE